MATTLRIVSILASIFAGLTVSFGQTDIPKDLDGWSKAKWGLGEAQVLEAFKGEAMVLPEKRNYKENYATVGIPDLKIGHSRFKVMFMLDSKTNLLCGVNIQPFDQGLDYRGPAVNPGPEALFDELKAMLTQKYGQPTSSGASSRDENGAIWKFPTTTIELHFMRSIIGKVMTLNYRQNQKADLDKI